MLPSFGFALDLGSLQDEVTRLEDALDAEVPAVLKSAADQTAAAARADHPYTDRTGNLTDSIGAGEPAGRYLGGTLYVHVVAMMPYAYRLEGRREVTETSTGFSPPFAFLAPAWARVAPRMDGELQDAVDRATARAGWR